jgi:hypothetical protein
MNKSLIIAVSLLFVCVVQGAGDDAYRTFTSTDGRSMRARIMEYNRASNELRIEQPEGRKIWLSPGVFDQCDHAYIREWIEADRILSSRSLRISLEKKTITTSFDKTLIYHEIELINRSGAPLDGVKIEYRYFITVSKDQGEMENPKRLVSGRLRVKQLENGRSQMLKTSRAPEYEVFGPKTYATLVDKYGAAYKQEIAGKRIGCCEVEGVWIRLYGPLVDGQPTYRDMCDPEDLPASVEWDEERVPLKDDFSFWDEPQPDKNVMSLVDVKKRGRAESYKQFCNWMELVYEQFRMELSLAEKCEVNEGVKFFYDSFHDRSGGKALYMGAQCTRGKLLSEAVYWCEIALEQSDDENQNRARQKLIRLYACSGDPQVQNGGKAVKYARIELAKDEKDPDLMDLMARAYAANDQYDLAVKIQKKAISRVEKTKGGRLKKYKERLELYQSGKPYVEADLRSL